MKFLSRIFVGWVIACCATNTFAAQICIMASCSGTNGTGVNLDYGVLYNYCSTNYGNTYYGNCRADEISSIKNATAPNLGDGCLNVNFSRCGTFNIWYQSTQGGTYINAGKFVVCFLGLEAYDTDCQWHIDNANDGGTSCRIDYYGTKPQTTDIYIEYDADDPAIMHVTAPYNDGNHPRTIDYSFRNCCMGVDGNSCYGISGGGSWSNLSNTNCQTTTGSAYTCSATGACSTSGSSAYIARCKAGYRSTSGSATASNTTRAAACSTLSCAQCGAGTYSSAASISCTKCAAGKYSTTVGATSSSTCLSCPTGTYSATLGASSSSYCLSCPSATGSYTDSGKTTIANGTTASTAQTAITACKLSNGTYYDNIGEFTISTTCSYNASATTNLH